MKREIITAYCGEGHGKTAAALGQGLMAADQGKSVMVIQFLKGRQAQELSVIKRMEPELKVFRFDKFPMNYCDLEPQEQEEEAANIRNAFAFAKKVLATGGCDLLILDEVLGLLELNLVTMEDMRGLLEAKEDATELVVTGIHIKEELITLVDKVYEISSLKEDEKK